ncbi:hypothetical protein D7X30_03625 [Corallococcus sp. AB011P]|nr:hypothetical protein D7X30_03625 [Corallococcus sp. AB011P]
MLIDRAEDPALATVETSQFEVARAEGAVPPSDGRDLLLCAPIECPREVSIWPQHSHLLASEARHPPRQLLAGDLSALQHLAQQEARSHARREGTERHRLLHQPAQHLHCVVRSEGIAAQGQFVHVLHAGAHQQLLEGVHIQEAHLQGLPRDLPRRCEDDRPRRDADGLTPVESLTAFLLVGRVQCMRGALPEGP